MKLWPTLKGKQFLCCTLMTFWMKSRHFQKRYHEVFSHFFFFGMFISQNIAWTGYDNMNNDFSFRMDCGLKSETWKKKSAILQQ